MNVFGKPPERRAKLTEMSLTPMIDCVFLLLLFFMVGMEFKQIDREVQARLPQGSEERDRRPAPLLREVWVTISKADTAAEPKPQIAINGQVMRDWAAARARLAERAELPGGRDDQVIIAPSDDARHGWVMTALDILKQCGYRNINFRR